MFSHAGRRKVLITYSLIHIYGFWICFLLVVFIFWRMGRGLEKITSYMCIYTIVTALSAYKHFTSLSTIHLSTQLLKQTLIMLEL